MGFKLEDIDSVRDGIVVDREGARIGKVEDVFLDRHTGRPAWAAVKTGLFGHRHTLVPITDAFLNFNAEVQVPFTKQQVKQAPNIEPNQELTPDLEREMWRHYGMSGYEAWQGADETHGIGLPDDAEDAASQVAAPVLVRLRRVVVVTVPAAPDDL
ncbi:MAG TPA: PRC-barrel domain-containing protein [Solirubrobacteraceae bacterium]|jgi:sporulation protein YlmC with PRC-barrel domain